MNRLRQLRTTIWETGNRFEWQVLLAALVIGAGMWGFIEIADEVTEGETGSFDVWMIEHMRQADDPSRPIGPEWVATAGRDVTALGDIAILSLIILIVSGYLLISRKYAAMWLVMIATVSGQLVSTGLKLIFSRERPSVVPHLADVSTTSFPSGHSMMSAVVFLTLGVLLARVEKSKAITVYILGVAMMLTVLVGLSRVYLGVHYPTDVLAGWLVGLTWALLCWLVARYLQRRGTVEDPDTAAEWRCR